jgi:riboflavin kinase / FMN adenylyltransferase
MKIIRGLKHLKLQTKESVVTIGVFDGLHAGHRKIVKNTVDDARKLGLTSVVVTFDPHPAKLLRPDIKTPSLISLKHRVGLIKELGVDRLLIINFTKEFSEMSADKFVKSVLVEKLKTREIFVGENFYFGKSAASSTGDLRKLARKHGFKVTAVKPVKIGGRIVSSSLIRKLIAKGDLADAARLLGRSVSVLGTVVKGSGIARGLGCPTANINPHHEVIPPKGVYAVRARVGMKKFIGILNIGFKPTFYSPRDKEPTIEVHLFGFKGNLYNKDIEVYFVKWLRRERKFKDRNALIRQIGLDIKTLYNIKGLC